MCGHVCGDLRRLCGPRRVWLSCVSTSSPRLHGVAASVSALRRRSHGTWSARVASAASAPSSHSSGLRARILARKPANKESRLRLCASNVPTARRYLSSQQDRVKSPPQVLACLPEAQGRRQVPRERKLADMIDELVRQLEQIVSCHGRCPQRAASCLALQRE